jgi:hypothetical protein
LDRHVATDKEKRVMTTRRSKALRGLLATGAAAGFVAAIGSGSPASADAGATAPTATPPAATISMRGGAKIRPHYTGSTSIATGQVLRIRNLANPKTIGPHTFTLVTTPVVPTTPKAQKDCFTPGKICLLGAIAHEFDEKTEKIGKQLVEAGQPGWDKRFTRTVKGDSWYSETWHEEFEQVVSAKAGTVLKYMCLIHPEMQGKLKVTG